MLEKRITIGILNHKYDHFLKEAIQSAYEQDYPNKEIIIIYNGLYGRAHIPVHKEVDRVVILKENSGCAGGKNAIFKFSDSDWVFHLDADDKLAESYSISRMMEIASKFEADMVFPNTSEKFSLETLKVHNPYPSNNLMNRKIWRRLGGWIKDDIIVEDWDFWIRIALSGEFNVQTTPEDLYFHRYHEANEGSYLADSRKYSELLNAIKTKYG